MSDLKPNTYASIEDSFEEQIPTASLMEYDYINETMGRKEIDTHVNRASSANLCPKRRWFQRNGFKGKPLAPRKIVNFLLGDLVELTRKYFIKEALVGPGKLYSKIDLGKKVGSFPAQGKEIEIYEQEEQEAIIAGLKISTHYDGTAQRNLDGKHELIEIKSAADWGYDDFKKNGPGDYLKQAHVNMQTTKAKELGINEVRFFYLRKSTGHIWDSLHPFDEEIAKKVARDFYISNQKEMPETPYPPIDEKFRGKPTGRKVVQWFCAYCPYIDKCHSVTIEFKKDQFQNSKPVFVVKE